MTDSSFDVRTPNDYFIKMLLPQYEDFIKNNSSSRHALLTIILAYHMYEWVHNTTFNENDFNEKYINCRDVATKFNTARLITNGTKHFSKKEIETKVQLGFSSDFSNDFAKPLIIHYENGREVSADDLIYSIVDFWQKEKDNGGF